MLGKVELITTFSLEVYARAIDVLISERIRYFIKTTYTGSRGRGRGRGAGMFASFGERPELDTQYQIFVRKRDYERAAHVVNNKMASSC